MYTSKMDRTYTCTLFYIFHSSIITSPSDNINFEQSYNVFEEDGKTDKVFKASHNDTYIRKCEQVPDIDHHDNCYTFYLCNVGGEDIRGFYAGTCDLKQKFGM